MIRRTLLSVFGPLLLGGCASATPAAEVPATPRVTRAPTHHSGAPVEGRWSLVSTRALDAGAAEHTLTLSITPRATIGTGATLSLAVPAGCALHDGSTTHASPALIAGNVQVHTVVLRCDAAPGDDLVATLDLQQEAWGVHAEWPWRFGRAPAELPPLPLAEPITVYGANLGAPVRMGGEVATVTSTLSAPSTNTR